jgi:hypothetical protein
MNWVCINDYFQFFMSFVRKRINISVTLVSEFYVLLYYETKVYMLFINKICLNQGPSKIIPYGSVVSEIIKMWQVYGWQTQSADNSLNDTLGQSAILHIPSMHEMMAMFACNRATCFSWVFIVLDLWNNSLLVDIRGGSRISKLGGGGALKKIAPSRGRRENIWVISCEKSRFYAKKSYFSNFRGGRAKFLGYFMWKITILRQKKSYFYQF